VTYALEEFLAELDSGELAEVRAGSGKRELQSPSRPLDAPRSSAVMEVSAEEYDALVIELVAPPEPSEALRRTMLLHRLPRE
jgi:hypothetical protein